MATVERNLVAIEDVRDLAREEGPCVTIVLSPHHPGGGTRPVAVRLRALLDEAGEALENRGVLPTDRESILEPMRALLSDSEFQGGNTESFALFRNPHLLLQVRLPWVVTDRVTVEGRFILTPLLEQIQVPTDFYLLALSRKRVRLLDCGWHKCVEVEPPDGMPTNLDEFLAFDQSNRHLNRSPGGSVFSEASDRDKQDRRRRDFFVAIDRVVAPKAAGEHRPLLLAGTADEVHAYRGVSSCTMLGAEGVITSPDGGPTNNELAEAGREAMKGWKGHHETNALRMYESLAGSSRVLTDEAAVVKAASNGRVEHLFFRRGGEHSGDYDRITGKTRLAGAFPRNRDDLVNAAAADTLMNSGFAWAGEPAGTLLAAVLRY